MGRTTGIVLGMVLLSTACGVAEDVLVRARGWLGDEPEPPATVLVRAEAEPRAQEPESSDGKGTGSTGSGSAGSGSTAATLPMSVASMSTGTTEPRSGDSGGTGGTGGTGDADTSGSVPEAETGSVPCVEGRWELEDDTDFYRRQLRRQARGRAVVRRSRSGSMSIDIERAQLRVSAEHRRLVFTTTLADNEVRYTIHVHGQLDAGYRTEGADLLVIDAPRTSTMSAREVARFPGDKSEGRTLQSPGAGRYRYACGPDTLELTLLEDGRPGPQLRLRRPPM
ncbi:MAG: hypothetical protein AB1Z98_21365 [Nannocystaceae bacterium]